MIIYLTEENIREIVNETIERIAEGLNRNEELICRNPYISIRFTYHCIEREYERLISERDIIEDASSVIKDVYEDYMSGKITDNDYIKIINKETCIVSVCSLKKKDKATRVYPLVVVTAYVWDGRINIGNGFNYYIGEESKAYKEAKQWNEENQDIVKSYVFWKYGIDVDKQRKKADYEYMKRTHPREMEPEYKMNSIARTYAEKEHKDKTAIHNAIGNNELNAIRKYFRDMDRMPLSSKWSNNRYLRANDLLQRRKDGRDADGTGLKVLGKIDLSKIDPKGANKERFKK